jgi:hypothetical protein
MAGGAVFLGLALTALAALRRDGVHTREAIIARCRFHPPDRRAGLWAAGATVAVLVLTGLVQFVMRAWTAGREVLAGARPLIPAALTRAPGRRLRSS